MGWFDKKPKTTETTQPEKILSPKPEPTQYHIRRVTGPNSGYSSVTILFEKPDKTGGSAQVLASKIQYIDPSEGEETIFFDYVETFVWTNDHPPKQEQKWSRLVTKVLLRR